MFDTWIFGLSVVWKGVFPVNMTSWVSAKDFVKGLDVRSDTIIPYFEKNINCTFAKEHLYL